MKKRLVLFITIVSILVTGCSGKSENNLVQQGKDALENHKYKEAQEFLSQALDADSTDEYARAMYAQAMRLENAIKYEEQGNYKKAIEELDIGEKIKNGSQSIKVDISNKKKELTKLNEEYIKSQEERKENAKIESGKDRYRVEQLANKANQSILEEKRKEEEAKKEEDLKNQQEESQKQEENKVESDYQVDKKPVDTVVSPPAKQDEPKI